MTKSRNPRLKPPVSLKHTILAALTLTVLMVFQSDFTLVDGKWVLQMNRVLIFGANYFVWAFSIPIIYRFTANFEFEAWSKKGTLKVIGFGLIICFVQLIVSNVIYYALILILFPNHPMNPLVEFWEFLPRAYSSRLVDFMVIFFLLRGLDDYRKLNSQKLAVAQLESQLTQSRLEALKMQLNPHFLFNSLHAIHSLIGYEDEKAKTMVLKIGNLLRRILELGSQQMIPLSEELDYLKDYLDIEQERFHDRLKVHYEVDDNLLSLRVPSLILQPLAENAIKHGISLLEEDGIVKLKVSMVDDARIEISIENSTNGQSSDQPSMGIGLSNLKKRLTQQYGNTYTLDILPKRHTFKVSIVLPIYHE